jgi:hypothetical protein
MRLAIPDRDVAIVLRMQLPTFDAPQFLKRAKLLNYRYEFC